MPNPAQPKLNPAPAILVFGRPSSPELTQAAWFRAEDKAAVNAAAAALKFSTIELHADARKALAVGVPEGVLKSSGRMIVGSVRSEVYRRIEEYVGKGASASDPSQPENAAGTTTKPHQNHPAASAVPATAGPAIGKPDSATARETLRVGARVLAAYWNEKREFEGFWLATVKRIEPGQFTLEWLDAPEYPPFKSRPQDIAVPHPEFRVSGK